MTEELSKQETPNTETVEQQAIAVEPEELSDVDLNEVAGGWGSPRNPPPPPPPPPGGGNFA